MTSEDVLRIPLPLDVLRDSLGAIAVAEAIRVGEETADAARLSPQTGLTAAQATAGGYLAVDVARKLNIARIYERRLETALSLLPASQRNIYERTISAQAQGVARSHAYLEGRADGAHPPLTALDGGAA